MSSERANDLARLCTDAVHEGADFPTIWSTLLKGHPLVEGIPQQRLEGGRSLLEIPMITVNGSCLTAKERNSVSDRIQASGGRMNHI